MRLRAYIPLVVLLITFVHCKKDSDVSLETLAGTWELASVDGGWVGRQTYPPGNGNTFTFTRNSYLRNIHYADTSYQVTGAFSIYLGKPCDSSPEYTLISFSADNMTHILSRTENTIVLGTPYECIADGVNQTYRKID